jgi:2-hydroxychromene-2-carboxylate isomerase
MTRLAFHFDFGSPNAYLSHLVIPAIEKRIGARFEYIPVLLGGVFKATNNRSPMESMAGIRNKPDYEKLELTRFLARHHITTYQRNPFFPVNTLTIMRAAVAAQHLGVFERYVDEVYRYMWSEGRNMGDPNVIAASLEESGLPVRALLEASASPEVKAELIANTEDSVKHGTFGSPTFFVDDEIYFGKDRLRDVEEAFVALHRRA